MQPDPDQETPNLPDPARAVTRVAWRDGTPEVGERLVAEETAIAFTYNRTTHAVMMATPADLEDFAIGFSLTDGVITDPAEILGLETVVMPQGIELRMDLADGRLDVFTERRRQLTGMSGCGLCGIESLGAAMRPIPKVSGTVTLSPATISKIMAELQAAQSLSRQTRAVHAAGFWDAVHGLTAVREDVGRHNALDKLAGALARDGVPARRGAVVLTSRVSVELVQKTALMGAPILIAVSAPTGLALKLAEEAGITVIAVARDDGFEVMTHGDRVVAPVREPVS